VSRGLGRIERDIIAILKSRSGYYRDEEAFDAWKLAEGIYDNDDRDWGKPPRTQRLAVLRAMRSLARKFPQRYALTGGKGRTSLYLYRVSRPPTELLDEIAEREAARKNRRSAPALTLEQHFDAIVDLLKDKSLEAVQKKLDRFKRKLTKAMAWYDPAEGSA
jgi:hypothetical protein